MSNTDDVQESVTDLSDSILTGSQDERLRHLQEIAGSIDRDTALHILESCDWDMTRAVNEVFGLSDESIETVIRQRNIATPAVNLLPPNQSIWRTTDPQSYSWWWTLTLLLEPFRLSYRFIYSVARFFMSFIWPDPQNQVTDAVGDVRRFIDHFRSTYVNKTSTSSSPRPFPPFYTGSYADALREAKRGLRFLIVYLHGDSHEDTHMFCENILLNEDVIRFLSDSEQIILWGCNVNSPEGYRVSRTLREHSYPFIGVIGLTDLSVSDARQSSGNTIGMALLGRIEGAVDAENLIRQLTNILNDHQAATVSARLDRKEREVTARIREEQDLAYKKSLEVDRAKRAVREELLRSAAREEAELAKEQREKDAVRNARSARRLYWRTHLPFAPVLDNLSTVQLSVKLPTGHRFSRVFLLSDSTKILYYFVLSLEESPENFEIQANFPKRSLPCQPEEESDLEDYMCNDDSSPDPSVPADNSVLRVKTKAIMTDWSPQSAGDPPSFQQLGLCKPEVLYVLDKDA